MKTRHVALFLVATALTLGIPEADAATTKIRSDLASRQTRQSTLDTAGRIAQRAAVPALPPTLPDPFSPSGFDSTSTDDQPHPEPAGPKTDREMLATLATRLKPSGTLTFQGATHLVVASRRYPLGATLMVELDGNEHLLELVALDGVTFTLRYRGSELTRPISVAK